MKKETKKVDFTSAKAPCSVWQQDVNGCDLPTQKDPVTGLPMCRECWDGSHKRGGVQVSGVSLWLLQRQQ